MNPEELEACECDGQGDLLALTVPDGLDAAVLADTAVSNDVPREDA